MTQPEFLPPASEKVREGVFLKRGLPSGRMLTVSLRWEGQRKDWTYDPAPNTWTELDYQWVLYAITPCIKMKLDRCYDIIEPGWVKKRLVEWKLSHPQEEQEREVVVEEQPFVVLLPLTEEMCRMILKRAV